MVQTRSRDARNVAGTSSQRLDSTDDSESTSETEGQSSLNNMTDYLEKLQGAISKVKMEVKRLRERKKELEEELADEREAVATTQAHRRSASALATIAKLKKQLRELKAENRKKDRTIRKMKEKELKEEANDLLDTTTDPETGEDPASRMRKLLRRFSDLMAETTLGDGDQCPICFEQMKLKESMAFPCQHIVCLNCFKQILPGKDESYTCPMCRASTPRREIESVRMSEEERWDYLLKVAAAWDAHDHRPNLDTSEEEAEDNFLTDGDPDEVASPEPSDEGSEEPDGGASGVDDGRESTPSSVGPRLPYTESPSKEKRKRLAELAEERARKKRRS